MIDVDALNLDDGSEAAKLFRPLYILILEQGLEAAADTLGMDYDDMFSLANEFVPEIVMQLATKVKAVADTTRDEIRAATVRATQEGWTNEQLRDALEQMAEIRSTTRAMLIARTETANALNLGSLLGYEVNGITHVDVLDGDEDEPCRSANGQRWTLEQARDNPLGHPNCQRAFVPVVE